MNRTVYLIGIGPGTPEGMTGEAAAVLEAVPVLVGAPRLLDPWRKSGKTLLEGASAAELAARVAETEPGAAAAVLFSGDVGFYSGAKALSAQLADCDTVWIPGVSSLAVFCARLRTTWQDAFVVNIHGGRADVANAARSHEKTFFLTGGELGPREICAALKDGELGHLPVWVGERLGVSGEKVRYGRADELCRERFEAPAVLLTANPTPERLGVSVPGIPDVDVEGGSALSEEVRDLILAKLRLRSDHILWDLGGGSGALAVQAAMAVPEGQVFSLEQDREALEQLSRNKAKFGAVNLKLVAGTAPEALSVLPAPHRLFLARGPYEEPLRAAAERSGALRAVAAVTALEDLSDALAAFECLGMNPEVVQLGVSRSGGDRREMTAQPPVWLLSGELGR